MNQVFLIETNDGTDESPVWVQIGITLVIPSEFQILYDLMLDGVSPENARRTRWRRLMSMIELQAYINAGVTVRCKDITTGIDWS